MKFLERPARNILDKVGKPFHEGGKLHKYFPVYDALETFAFTPNKVTTSGAHIRDGIDLKRTMFMVILAMIPCLLFGMWNTGHQHYIAIGEMVGWNEGFWAKFWHGAKLVLPLVVVSYASGLLIEFIICIIKKHAINEGFLVSGMLIPLIMPVDVELWIVAVSTAFAVLFGKEVFGGTGMNILNVALTTRAFIFFAYPTRIAGNNVWVDVPRDAKGAPEGVTQAFAAGDTVVGGTEPIIAEVAGTYNSSGQYLEGVDAYTGETPLGWAAQTMDYTKKMRAATEGGETELAAQMQGNIDGAIDSMPDMMDMVIGTIPGSIGETSVIMCLLGAGLLLATQVASWRVMLSMLIGGSVMGLIFNAIGANAFMDIPWYQHLVMGSFMFGMVFMATDPVSAAQTDTGKLIYGFGCGFFGIMIRVFNPAYPEGIMLAILFMNVMAPMIDHYVIQSNISRRKERWAKAEAHRARMAAVGNNETVETE